MDFDPAIWRPFDPSTPPHRSGSPEGPEAPPTDLFGRLRLGAGQLLAIALSHGVHRSDWVEPAVRRLASAVGAKAGRVLLIDGSLERPILGGADSEPREGLTDAFLFGASLDRIARKAGDRLRIVEAGTPVADPARILADDGWDQIRERLLWDEALGVVVLPLGLDGAGTLLARVDEAVLFCLASEEGDGVIRGDRRWSAVLGPPDPDAPPAAGGGGEAVEDPGEGIAARSGGSEDEAEEEDARPEGVPVGVGAEERSGPETTPPAESPEPPTRRRRSPAVLVLVAILVVLALVALAWQLGYLEVPPVLQGAPEAANTAPAPVLS